MDEAPLLHKDTEELRVKEMSEERSLGRWRVLQEPLLVKEEGGVTGPLGGCREQRTKTHSVGREEGRNGHFQVTTADWGHVHIHV